MSNRQMRLHERLHCGLPPERNMPLHSACGEPNGQYEFDAWHGLSCVVEKGTSITDRHDDVKYALAHWATKVGGRVTVEPRKLHEQYSGSKARRRRAQRGRREADRRLEHKEGKNVARFKPNPDLIIEGLGKPIMVDVVVKHSLAPSHVEQCAAEDGSVLREAEAQKHRDYDGLADQVEAKFFAFAVETTGRLGSEALAFIKHIIHEGARFKNVWAAKEIVNDIYRTVAVAIARGNADIIDSNLNKARRAEFGE
jgi:hypothetical protein